VVQIAVVKKAPIYSNSTTKFYFYEDKDGNITGYIAKCYYMFGRPVDWFGDYEKMDSFNKDNIKYDTGDEIQFTYNGETYTLTVHKDPSLDPKEYPDETFPNFGKVPDDLNIDKENTTIKGKYFFSITDFDKKETEYDKQRSEFTSVSEKQSRHESDSIKNSQAKSESLSLSTSKSNSITSDSISKSTSLSLENSDIGSRSKSHSLLESEEISTSLSNSQSTATSVSESQSTSTSVSESQSTSTSVSESQSTSTSVSESQSTSTSVSESLMLAYK
jgi:hypothetical protein